MNNGTILFWGIFVMAIVVYHRILILIETYFVPLWSTDPTGSQFGLMFVIVLLLLIASLITAQKLSRIIYLFFFRKTSKR
ncbi:hypothetical protein [Alkalihalobacillus sp. TS-13]|uniref:hypothetical protein n=1 Tax=Alkalihalobacillus sp. TS-13 TaxID=2842455 RepID=UPI001C882658|nr:hypothetical protein [Alkalihalobacillus sp. TS-13]